MRSVFLSSFHLLISRNILSTELPALLVSRGVRIIVIAPEYKRAYLEKEFGGPNVVVEGVLQNRPSRFWRGLVFKRLSHFMLNTESIRVYQDYVIWAKKKSWSYRTFFLFAQFLGRRSGIVRLIREFDYLLRPRNIFSDLFERHHPDLVFAADILNENDVSLIQEARARGIPTLGMTRSWDNLTVLGLVRAMPDRMVVQTERLKEEARRLDGARPDRISVVGVPHYDRYAKGPTRPREIFFKAFGLDPQKKLVIFTPVGDLYVRENDVDRPVLDVLASRTDINVIVRLPPADRVSGLEDFRAPPNMMAFDRPCLVFDGGNRELTRADDDNLLDEMYYADLVITGPSTIAIEASLFGKPTIMANFHRRPKTGLEGVFPYRYDHLRPILESGGVRLADTREEFLFWLERYLADPGIDEAGRKKIVHEQCGGFPAGGATGRLADAILGMLEGSRETKTEAVG